MSIAREKQSKKYSFKQATMSDCPNVSILLEKMSTKTN